MKKWVWMILLFGVFFVPVVAEEPEEEESVQVVDLQETITHAKVRLASDDAGVDSGLLSSKGRIAQFPAVADPSIPEYITMFDYEGRPAYCIEPEISTILDGSSHNSVYQSSTWWNVDESTRMLCKRYAFFGYGFSGLGSMQYSPEAYAATQMLVWKKVSPAYYSSIESGVHMCPSMTYEDVYCSLDPSGIFSLMDTIENYANNYDTVPSFANAWHGLETYDLKWDETLVLHDDNHVLSWFESAPQQERRGVHVRVDGDDLLVDIDDLYYSKEPLYFSRKSAEWANMSNGIMVYTMPGSQRLMGESGVDPTPGYQLAFRLSTADLEVRKLDEYGNSGSFARNTEFVLGWYEDPEQQYRSSGLKDMNWTGLHDPSILCKSDETGLFNDKELQSFYYPVRTEDGSSVRVFKTDEQGVLRINGFLPANHSWWIREINTENALVPYGEPMRVAVGGSGSSSGYSVINGLRDVTLSLSKKDVEEDFLIDGALFEVYEIGDLDLDREDTKYGLQTAKSGEKIALTHEMLAAFTNLEEGDSFLSGAYKYTIVQEEDEKVLVRRVLFDSKEEPLRISRYALPMDGTEFAYEHVLCRKGTEEQADDERISLSFRVVDQDADRVLVQTDSVQKHVLYDETTSPSYSDFAEAAKRMGVSLSEGKTVELSGITYRLYRVNTGSLLADVQREFEVDLLDQTPNYEDLKHPEQLRMGDEFTLSWPMVLEDGTVQEESVSFTVVSRDREVLKLRSEEGECIVQLPQWICFEDVPEKTEEMQELEILQVQQPVYRVRDSRGNVYQVLEKETKLLEAAEDPEQIGTPMDLTYAELTGLSDGDELACSDPLSTVGCPLGKQVHKELTITRSVPWSFPVFEDVVEKLDSEEALVFDDVEYSVVSRDEHTLVLSFEQEGRVYRGELAPGAVLDQAVYEEEVPVDFVIEEVQGKEFEVRWLNMQVPLTSLCTKDVFRLTPRQDPGSTSWVSSLNYNADSFTDENGVNWTVLVRDAVNHQAVVESVLGRFEVDGDRVVWALPVQYTAMLALESEQGRVVKEGDRVSFAMERALCVKDEVEIGDGLVRIEDLEYENSDGTNRLRDQIVQQRVSWLFPLDCPLDRSLFLSEEEVEVDGVVYERTVEKRTDGTVITLKNPVENIAYVLQEKELVHSTQSGEDAALLEVAKPDGPVWQDVQNALLEEKRAAQHVTVQGKQVLIQEDLNVELEDGTILSVEELQDLPLDLVEKDVYRIKGEDWQIVSIVEEEETGVNLVLKRNRDGKVVTVQEHVPGTYPLVSLRFHGVNTPLVLDGQWKLAQGNPHIVVEQEEDKTSIVADGNATAVLLKTDEDGTVIDQMRVVFEKDGMERTVEGIAVFAGKTGSAHVRLVDPLDHNMPLSFVSVDVKGQDGESRTLKSDVYGVLNISALPAGVYTYVHPCTGEETQFEVDTAERTGQLSVDSLKWGRTYMACEIGLPEGYDYGDSPVCTTFTMDLKKENSRLNGTVENELRRLSLKVYKVDQEDERILLDDAWFTVEEMVEEEEPVLAPIRLQDVPDSVQVGTQFALWPARKDGEEVLYRLENVLDEQLIVSRLENGRWGTQLHVEKTSVNVESGMLYEDVKRACTLLEAGCVFRLKEKESAEQLKFYRVLELEKENGEDVFGAPMEETVLKRVVVEEVGDEAHEEIVLRADGPQDMEKEVQEYISGGIFIRRQIEVNPVPVSYEKVQEALKNGETTVPVLRTRTVRMPDYVQIRKAEANGETQMDYDGKVWSFVCDEKSCVLSLEGQSFELFENTKSGAVSIVEEEEGTITVEEDGRIYVQDSKGNVWKVEEEERVEKRGEAGVHASILDEEGELVADGYTDAEGKLVFAQFEEGVYSVVEPDRKRIVEVGRGMIHLPEVRYGHKLRICETKSPLGYMIQQACAVFEPRAAYDEREVLNKRTNAKIKTTIRKRLIRYRMGVELWQDA